MLCIAKVSWRQDVTVSRCHGVRMSRCQDVMVSGCHGVRVSRCQDVMVSQCHGECHSELTPYPPTTQCYSCSSTDPDSPCDDSNPGQEKLCTGSLGCLITYGELGLMNEIFWLLLLHYQIQPLPLEEVDLTSGAKMCYFCLQFACPEKV